jgi:hypothetical protein
MALPLGAVFVSPIDLNREFGLNPGAPAHRRCGMPPPYLPLKAAEQGSLFSIYMLFPCCNMPKGGYVSPT